MSAFHRNATAPKGFESRCKQCTSDYHRSEAYKQVRRRYRSTPKGREGERRWRTALSYQEWRKQWVADNPERLRELSRMKEMRRRARKRGLAASFTASQWQDTLEYFAYRCAYCGTDAELVQEHFVPVARSGAYTARNIVPACTACNLAKNAALPDEWCAPETYERVAAYLASRED